MISYIYCFVELASPGDGVLRMIRRGFSRTELAKINEDDGYREVL